MAKRHEIFVDGHLKPPAHSGSFGRLAPEDFYAAGAAHTELVMKRNGQGQIPVDEVGTRPPHHWWQRICLPTKIHLSSLRLPIF